MKQYLDHVKNILTNGVSVTDRTGVGTRSIVGAFLTFNLQEGFPIVTVKRTNFLGLMREMVLFFLQGTPYITALKAAGVNIWNQWAIDESVVFPQSPEKLLELMLKAQSLPGYLATHNRTKEEISLALTGVSKAKWDLKILGLCREIYRYLNMAGHTGINTKMAITEIEQRLYYAYLICDDENAVSVLNAVLETGMSAMPDIGAILTQMGAPGYVSELHDSLGPIYGVQWRHWVGAPTGVMTTTLENGQKSHKIDMAEIDQIDKLMKDLDKYPNSRRHIVSAWDPRYLPEEGVTPQQNVANGKMALAPCHKDFQVVLHPATLEQRKAQLRQIYVEDTDYAGAMSELTDLDETAQNLWLNLHNVPTTALYLHLNLRSSDTFVGLPFNIAQYALLAELIAKTKGYLAAQLTVGIVDAHIYSNHLDDAQKILTMPTYKLPRLRVLNRRENLWDYTPDDIGLFGYESGPFMQVPVAL